MTADVHDSSLTPTQGTDRRSTLRIVRESELLGAALSARHSRENLVLEAKFLRDDLPYFVELFGEVASSTKYQRTPPACLLSTP